MLELEVIADGLCEDLLVIRDAGDRQGFGLSDGLLVLFQSLNEVLLDLFLVKLCKM